MIPVETLQWRGDIVLTRDLTLAGDRSEFYSRADSGEFVAIHRGVWVSSAVWSAARDDARAVLRLRGAAALAPGCVFSHQSAAALWGLPSPTPWPRRAHILHPPASAAKSSSIFIRHRGDRSGEVVQLRGLNATGLARTVVDVASSSDFGESVCMADAALHRTVRGEAFGVTKATLLDELDRVPLRHGSARATRVVEFSDGAADRPGESMSRVSMSIARITPPQLQVQLAGASGRWYWVDFWWPELRLIGEFDGAAKYSDPVFLAGRTPEQALRDEKFREDDLRAAGHGMSRWGWALAISPQALRTHLHAAGVR